MGYKGLHPLVMDDALSGLDISSSKVLRPLLVYDALSGLAL